METLAGCHQTPVTIDVATWKTPDGCCNAVIHVDVSIADFRKPLHGGCTRSQGDDIVSPGQCFNRSLVASALQ